MLALRLEALLFALQLVLNPPDVELQSRDLLQVLVRIKRFLLLSHIALARAHWFGRATPATVNYKLLAVDRARRGAPAVLVEA